MSKLSKVVRNGYKLAWWQKTAIPAAEQKIVRLYYKSMGGQARARSVMSKEWDHLILLDACRYDMFKALNTIDGKLRKRTSLGSTSQEYFESNFTDTTHFDTVYVTANPFLKSLGLEETFYDVDHVWDTGWNEELNTVLPSTMVERTIAFAERYPDKRIISHFMQPHQPFIGEFGREAIPKQTGFTNTRSRARGNPLETISDTRVVWNLLDDGVVDVETVWKAYKENLEITLPLVEELIEALGHRTVVSADHGNLVNERVGLFPFRLSGHPRGIYVDELVTVPWLVIEQGDRKEITAGNTTRVTQNEVSNEVTERLNQLGYR